MNTKSFIAIFAIAGSTLLACEDDGGTPVNNQNPFTPGASSGTTPGSSSSSSGNASSSGNSTQANCGKPAGCFCGTPTTQAEFLNRCTTAAALPVDLTVKPATAANVP